MRPVRLPNVLFLQLIFLAALTSTIPGQSDLKLDMSNLGKAWQDYVAGPSAENARKIYTLLPDGIQGREIRLEVDVRNLINQNLNVLERQMFSGDRDSVQVAFRLFVIADSNMTVELGKILGNFMRFNARIFLQELNNHRRLVPDLSIITCSFQNTLQGDAAGQELEKKTRIKAIGYIDDTELKGVKKDCLKALKKCDVK